MKILFISNLYPPNVFGGYERLCFEVASALQAKGHQIIVLTSSYGLSSDENYNHQVIRKLFLFATEGNIYQPYNFSQPSTKKYQEQNKNFFDLIVKQESPSVIFVWNLHFFTPDFLQAIEESNIPKCYLLTDNWLIAQLNPSFIASYFSKQVFTKINKRQKLLNALRPLYQNLVSSFYKSPSFLRGRAIFPSIFMQRLYRNAGFRFSMGTSICYHGVKFLDSKQSGYQPRNKLCSNSQLRLLFAGRIVDIKGTHIAIESMHLVQNKLGVNVDILLTIVGDSQDQEYLQRLKLIIEQNNLHSSVVFEDLVTENDLFTLFQKHDIYLFPSLYEPFSLTLILALQAGIPTIASNIGGNVEIVRNNKTGLLFQSGDSASLAKQICLLYKNSNLRQKLSQSASTYASTFTFEKLVCQIEQQLEEVNL